MIRCVVEYIIVCDAKSLIGKECPEGGAAFGAATLVECSESAKAYGWTQATKRLWLCPRCAKATKPSTQQSATVSALPQTME